MTRSILPSAAMSALALAAALAMPTVSRAQSAAARNPVTADPNVPRPKTVPVIVPLFTSDVFNDYSGRPFSYTPPARSGPWSKIVLVANFSENAGVQYDRTCTIGIGNANIFFGTTPEPTSNIAPRWHIERDVTDYASLLSSPQGGEAQLFNVVVPNQYTGVITGSAFLEFYPVSSDYPKPPTPDAVIPLNSGNGPDYLDSASDSLTLTTNFPQNVTAAYLDLVTQPQQQDEFWYTNVPDDLSSELDEYGGTSFREAEISVDGQPAGVAPVYPWIFTGGLDPDLWLPIPGVQTLNFKPYRVDLTPFAATLDDGKSHTMSVNVTNNSYYFSVTGSLLLYRDPYLKKVTGSLLQNTVGEAPDPTIADSVVTPTGTSDIFATINTSVVRRFTTAGVVNTSHGPVTTKSVQTISFSNDQDDPILVSPSSGNVTIAQTITQLTNVSSQTTTSSGKTSEYATVNLSYPLTVAYTEGFNSDFSEFLSLTAHISQEFVEKASLSSAAGVFSSSLSDAVSSTAAYPASLPIASEQLFTYSDTNGHIYTGRVTSSNGLVTSDTRSGGLPTRHPIKQLP